MTTETISARALCRFINALIHFSSDEPRNVTYNYYSALSSVDSLIQMKCNIVMKYKFWGNISTDIVNCCSQPWLRTEALRTTLFVTALIYLQWPQRSQPTKQDPTCTVIRKFGSHRPNLERASEAGTLNYHLYLCICSAVALYWFSPSIFLPSNTSSVA